MTAIFNFPFWESLSRYGFFFLAGVIISAPLWFKLGCRWQHKGFPKEVQKNNRLKERLKDKEKLLKSQEADIIQAVNLFREFGNQFDAISYSIRKRGEE